MQPAPRFEPPPAPPPVGASAFPLATSRARLLVDRLARALVRAGGFAVVFSLVGILAFLLAEVAPLFRGANVSAASALALDGGDRVVLLADASLARVASVGLDGRVTVLDAATGAVEATLEAPVSGEVIAVGDSPGESTYSLLLGDGRVIVVPVEWPVDYGDSGARSVRAEFGTPVELSLEASGASVVAFSARARASRAAVAATLSDGTLVVVRRSISVNDFTGERDEQTSRWQIPAPAGVNPPLLGMTKVVSEDAVRRGLKTMEGFVLAGNTSMLRLARRLGFSIAYDPDDRSLCVCVLPLNPSEPG